MTTVMFEHIRVELIPIESNWFKFDSLGTRQQSSHRLLQSDSRVHSECVASNAPPKRSGLHILTSVLKFCCRLDCWDCSAEVVQSRRSQCRWSCWTLKIINNVFWHRWTKSFSLNYMVTTWLANRSVGFLGHFRWFLCVAASSPVSSGQIVKYTQCVPWPHGPHACLCMPDSEVYSF